VQVSAQSETTVELHNPIIPGFFADPSLVEYEGKFYVYATVDPWGKDWIACWVSDDFQSWYLHTPDYPTKEACTSPTSNENKVWAPSVVKRGDAFYMFVSVGSEVWCGASKHPLGPWENPLGNKPLIPFDTTRYYHVIDAEAFIDDDGKAYYGKTQRQILPDLFRR
jgi:beta-xylosidase